MDKQKLGCLTTKLEREGTLRQVLFHMSVGDDISRTADSPHQATWNLIISKYGVAKIL